MKNAFLLVIVTMLMTSCTIHKPFQSNEGKAQYHLRQAYYHQPSLADSVEHVINIPRKQSSIIVSQANPILNRVRLFLDTLVIKDSSTGVVLSLSQNDSLDLNTDIETAPSEIRYKTKTLEVESIPDWVYTSLILLSSLVIFFVAMWISEKRNNKALEETNELLKNIK